MKLLYQVPETTIVIVNGQKDLMQYEVLGASKEGKWESGTNTMNFEEENMETATPSAPNLWDE